MSGDDAVCVLPSGDVGTTKPAPASAPGHAFGVRHARSTQLRGERALGYLAGRKKKEREQERRKKRRKKNKINIVTAI